MGLSALVCASARAMKAFHSAVVWGAAELLRTRPRAEMALAAAACAAFAVVTFVQAGYWEDGAKHLLALQAKLDA